MANEEDVKKAVEDIAERRRVLALIEKRVAVENTHIEESFKVITDFYNTKYPVGSVISLDRSRFKTAYVLSARPSDELRTSRDILSVPAEYSFVLLVRGIKQTGEHSGVEYTVSCSQITGVVSWPDNLPGPIVEADPTLYS